MFDDSLFEFMDSEPGCSLHRVTGDMLFGRDVKKHENHIVLASALITCNRRTIQLRLPYNQINQVTNIPYIIIFFYISNFDVKISQLD